MIHPLLIPRYMVEEDYPNSPFKIGDVLNVYIDLPYRGQRTCMIGEYDPWKITHIDEPTAQKYPKIFRPMPWHEGRKIEEMPKYVKFKRYGRISGCTWSMVGDFLWFDDSTGNSFKFIDWINMIIPATEDDYLEYNKTKSKRVCLETAICLKKAGYDVPCNAYYHNDKNGNTLFDIDDEYENYNSFPQYPHHFYSAPALHEATDWLRSQGVHVWVMYSGKKGWLYGVAELDNTVYGMVDNYYDTFEAAYEAAIVHALKYKE